MFNRNINAIKIMILRKNTNSGTKNNIIAYFNFTPDTNKTVMVYTNIISYFEMVPYFTKHTRTLNSGEHAQSEIVANIDTAITQSIESRMGHKI